MVIQTKEVLGTNIKIITKLEEPTDFIEKEEQQTIRVFAYNQRNKKPITPQVNEIEVIDELFYLKDSIYIDALLTVRLNFTMDQSENIIGLVYNDYFTEAESLNFGSGKDIPYPWKNYDQYKAYLKEEVIKAKRQKIELHQQMQAKFINAHKLQLERKAND